MKDDGETLVTDGGPLFNLKKLCEGTGLTATATDCSGSATTSLSWNGMDELVALAKAGTAVLSEAYAYDDAGRRVRKTSAGATSYYMLDGPDGRINWVPIPK